MSGYDGEIVTAQSIGLAVCRTCHQVTRNAGAPCETCGAAVHFRAPHSLQRVWAFWLAGLIAYIPGNLLPIMRTESLTEETASTIIGGVVTLIHYDSYAVAGIVFFASIIVPVTKFVVIAVIATAIQRKKPGNEHQMHTAHRWIELIGRWSMIDVFVVAALAALIQFGNLMSIAPGGGMSFFALSVGLTMLSAQALDPRLIWDRPHEEVNDG